MANYRFVTGPFEGSVVEEGSQILDVPFDQLDADMQIRIREFLDAPFEQIDADMQIRIRKFGVPVSMDSLKEDYENSWDAEETDDEPDLKPVSEW